MKKENQLTIGEYEELNQCQECHRLQHPFIGDYKGIICPECGSKKTKKVIARWYWVWENSAFISRRILKKYEIKNESGNITEEIER